MKQRALSGRRRIAFARPSDDRLVRRASAGDEKAFALIFERYHQDLYRFCRAILSSPDDAEDALQNTISRVLKALPGERRPIQLQPWLFRIARNEAISLIRSRRGEAELREGVTLVGSTPQEAIERRDELRQLVRDLKDLPERQRSALVMRELSGLTHDEVASALGISGGAARQAVYEARTALAELEEGRQMQCDAVRKAISDQDGRILRGRKIRAHMRSCEGCTDFALAIEGRREKLALISPPLPAAAAGGMLAAIFGGSGAGAGGGAAGAAGAASVASIGTKAAAVIATGAVIAGGGGKLAGVDLPLVGADEPAARAMETRDGANDADAEPEAARPSADPALNRSQAGSKQANRAGAKPSKRRNANGSMQKRGNSGQGAAGQGSNASQRSAAGGASAAAQETTDRPGSPPGSSVSQDRSEGKANAPTPGSPAHANGQGQAQAGLAGQSDIGGKSDKKVKPPK